MEPDLNLERQQAHALLDMLSAEKLNAVRSLLKVMVDPVSRALANAPPTTSPSPMKKSALLPKPASGSSTIPEFRLNK